MAMLTKFRTFYHKATFWQAVLVASLFFIIGRSLFHLFFLWLSLSSQSWAAFIEETLFGSLVFGILFTLFIHKSRSR